jgi:thioredoxin-like negative regulator of GroEL
VTSVTSAKQFAAILEAAEMSAAGCAAGGASVEAQAPIIVIFYTQWAPGSASLLADLVALAAREVGRVRFASVDVDAVPDIPACARIRSFPAAGAWFCGRAMSNGAPTRISDGASLERFLERLELTKKSDV